MRSQKAQVQKHKMHKRAGLITGLIGLITDPFVPFVFLHFVPFGAKENR